MAKQEQKHVHVPPRSSETAIGMRICLARFFLNKQYPFLQQYIYCIANLLRSNGPQKVWQCAITRLAESNDGKLPESLIARNLATRTLTKRGPAVFGFWFNELTLT